MGGSVEDDVVTNEATAQSSPAGIELSSPSLLTLLTSLPPDLLRTLLSQNCSGKTLSTLRLGLLSASFAGRTTTTTTAASTHGTSTATHDGQHEIAAAALLVELITSILENRLIQCMSPRSSAPRKDDYNKKYMSQLHACIRSCQQQVVQVVDGPTDAEHGDNQNKVDYQPIQSDPPSELSSLLSPSKFSWKVPAMVDYLEQQETCHALWCGRLEFPSFIMFHDKNSPSGDVSVVRWDHVGGGKTCHANVVLQATPSSWSMKALRVWYSVTVAATTTTSVSYSSTQNPPPSSRPSQKQHQQHKRPQSCLRLSRPQPYNFVPIPPYGRLLGHDTQSQQVLDSIGKYLEHSNLVLTLPMSSFVSTTTSTTCNGRRRTRQSRRSLIVRVISPQQAQCRMQERFGSSYRPTDWDTLFAPSSTSINTVGTTGRNNNMEGLICSWEYEGDGDNDDEDGDNDDSNNNNGNLVMEAILEILRNYDNPGYL